jgi:carbonic anhydrase
MDATATPHPHSAAPQSITPAEALQRLVDGNNRWATDTLLRPDQTATRRRDLTGGQSPFAVIFSCIDSRVPPEIVFDQGLGDLFVLRTAAHTLDELIEASVEYGPVELGTPLIVVMGHQNCGAVTAAVNAIENGVSLPAHLPDIVDAVTPAYVHASDSDTSATIDATVRRHTHLTAESLRNDESLKALCEKGRLDIVEAYYGLADGAIEWSPRPEADA